MLINIDDTETFIGLIDDWARMRTGVHRTTVARWREKGWPPWLLRLAALELGGHLGLIHPEWRGWRIEKNNGQLVAPADITTRTFTPGDLIAAPILHQLRRELDRERMPPQQVGSTTRNRRASG